MILKNAIKVTGAYKGKTKFPFLNNLREDDVVIISIGTAQKIKGAANGNYATMVSMTIKDTITKFQCSLVEFEKYLAKIPHTEAREFYTRSEVKSMLEDVYAKTAASYNDYGKYEWDFVDDAAKYAEEYIKNPAMGIMF